jgi:hypothetical protein
MVHDMLEDYAVHPRDWSIRRRPKRVDGSWLFDTPLEEARYALTDPDAKITTEQFLTLSRLRGHLYRGERAALEAFERGECPYLAEMEQRDA